MEGKINLFLEKHNIWKLELLSLRKLLNDTDLTESVKWGMPSYGINSQNVIGIGAFKKHIGLWFHQGSLLSDPYNLLINAQKGKTKAMRSIQITKEEPVDANILSLYIAEAIENTLENKKGTSSKPRKINRVEIVIPIELQSVLDIDSLLAEMFRALTIIQQNDYAEYISSAKRASTKTTRLEKIIPLIKKGQPISAIWSK